MAEFVARANYLEAERKRMKSFAEIFQRREYWSGNVSPKLAVEKGIYSGLDRAFMLRMAELKRQHPRDAEFLEAVKTKAGVSESTAFMDLHYMDLDVEEIASEYHRLRDTDLQRSLFVRIVGALRPMDLVEVGLMDPLLRIPVDGTPPGETDQMTALFKSFGRRPLDRAEAERNYAALAYALPRVPDENVRGLRVAPRAFTFIRSDDMPATLALAEALPEDLHAGSTGTKKLIVHPRREAVEALFDNRFLTEDHKRVLNLLLT